MTYVFYSERLGRVIGVFYPTAKRGRTAGCPDRVWVADGRDPHARAVTMTRGGPLNDKDGWR